MNSLKYVKTVTNAVETIAFGSSKDLHHSPNILNGVSPDEYRKLVEKAKVYMPSSADNDATIEEYTKLYNQVHQELIALKGRDELNDQPKTIIIQLNYALVNANTRSRQDRQFTIEQFYSDGKIRIRGGYFGNKDFGKGIDKSLPKLLKEMNEKTPSCLEYQELEESENS